MISVTISDHGTQARLAELSARLERPVGLARVLGREGRNRLVAHFRRKDREEPNRLGGERQHFWLQVARATQSPVEAADGSLVTITVNHPAIAQKIFGGTIRAKRTRFLTIPVSPEAYGRTASTFERETGLKLFLLKVGPSKSPVLAAARGGGIQVEYLLRRSVKQSPDPTALPDEGDFNAALLGRAESYVARITAEANGGQATGGNA